MGALAKALVLRPIVREKTRTALTLLGIAVGVAVVVAIALSNQSALRAFRESVDAVAGRANWQIAADLLSDLHFRDYRYARVVTAKNESLATYLSLFRDDSVVLSAAYAREHALGLESKLTLSVQGVTKTM